MTRHYHVTVTREDDTWFADVAGLAPGLVGATDVARFADLDVEVCDLVAGLTDTDPDNFGLTWRIVFGATDVTERARAARGARASLSSPATVSNASNWRW